MHLTHPSIHPHLQVSNHSNGIILELIEKFWFYLKIYDLWSYLHTHTTHWSQSLAIEIMGLIHSLAVWLFDNWHIIHNCEFWTFFWHLTYCLNHLSPVRAIFIFRWLSLHLNHLIAYWLANYDWPFWTLPFGLFGSNLDTRDLETYPRTYSDHFWNMSIFDDSRAVRVLFRKWVVSENQSFLDEGAIITRLISLILGGEVPRLNHGPICFPIPNT